MAHRSLPSFCRTEPVIPGNSTTISRIRSFAIGSSRVNFFCRHEYPLWLHAPVRSLLLHPINELEQLRRVNRGLHGVAVGRGNAREGVVVLPDDIPFLMRPG